MQITKMIAKQTNKKKLLYNYWKLSKQGHHQIQEGWRAEVALIHCCWGCRIAQPL